MRKILLINILILSLSIGALASSDFNEIIQKNDSLYQTGKYEQVIKELIPILNSIGDSSYENVSQKGIIHIRNLIADSYRMLEMYTNATRWYWGNNEGYFDNYSRCNLELLQRISVIKGQKIKIDNNGYFKLLDNVTISEKRQYFKKMIALNANRNVNLELERYLAGDITLENLLQNASKDNIVEYTTYAGLNLEVSGDLQKARELYTQVLSQKSDKIESLLAANRMGLLALKMIYYNKKDDYANLPTVFAAKVSSAKLEGPRLYSSKNFIDDDPATTWVPVGKNSQIGQWAELSFDDPVQIKSLTLINGYAKNNVTFKNNNRIKTATLKFSDGSKIKITLKDNMKPQKIRVNRKSRVVRLIINEVYEGIKYDDTCLSGLDVDFN